MAARVALLKTSSSI